MNNRNTQSDTKPPLILKYDISTTPSPLLPGPNEKVTITLHESSYICDTIEISVPVGDDPADIFITPPPTPVLCISNNHWTTGDPKPIHDTETGLQYQQWTIGNVANNYQVFQTDFTITGGTVNAAGGTAQIVIDEDSGTTLADLENREGFLSVTKSSKPLFYLRNLIAIDYLSPGFPCGAFQLGYRIEISWEGNGTSYDLYQSGIPDPIYSGTATNYTLNNGISDTTTFCCVASNDNEDKLFESLTLTVINPVLTAQTVTTTEGEEIGQDMETNQAKCNILSLSTNPTVMADPAPNVNNLINNSSTFNLSGDFTVDNDATISGLLTCTDITTNNLTIQESINFSNQGDALFDPFVLVGSGIDVPYGIRLANTDGYAIVTVSGPSAISGESVAYGALGIAGILDWIYTYGGNSNGSFSEVDGFLMLPVPAGAYWMYHGENLTSSPLTTINVYWFPTGNDSGSENAGVKATLPPVTDTGDDKNNPHLLFKRYLAAKRERRSELINSIETILDGTFDAVVREEMIQQLMKL